MAARPSTAGGERARRAGAPVFPFSAIVGQEGMKLALEICAVDPLVSGALIRGHRGTAKSTAVRALAALLPPIEVVAGCPFSCDPARPEELCDPCRERWAGGERPLASRRQVEVVDLPIGASEDRLLGSLDLEAALARGERRFEPGLLARAHRAILYVDEVNLLSDHLVDLLLDAAAMGESRLEREGVSFRHACRFVLVGTMNPEEGELRPQLLDRFGLCVEVRGSDEPAERAEVAKRRLAFDADPGAFRREWAEAERAVSDRIAAARGALESVEVAEAAWLQAARFSIAFGVEGHRSDLTMVRAARALVALEGRPAVTVRDLGRAAGLALPHRVSSAGREHAELDPAALAKLVAELEAEEPGLEAARPGPGSKKKTTAS